ncbi:MAG: hypothetical protein SXV54_16210 [Chloroflexota bacterium]|nr:hypothetical protein [Chloroflexota bacterium]
MEEMVRHRNVGSRLKVFAGLMATAFAVTLALVVGNRLSDEALAVLAGAVCSVGAAIPTSLLVVVVSRRRDEGHVDRTQQPSTLQGMYPPVVVVAPPGGQQRPGDWNTFSPALPAPVERQFTVVGGAPVDAEVMSYERHY